MLKVLYFKSLHVFVIVSIEAVSLLVDETKLKI